MIPIHQIPVDQRTAIRRQRDFANLALAYLRASIRGTWSAPVTVVPNGYWRSRTFAGVSYPDHVLLPAAGEEGALPGDELLLPCGLNPVAWMRVLTHEITHLVERQFEPDFRKQPRDDQRLSWLRATALVARTWQMPMADIGDLHWPRQPPKFLIDLWVRQEIPLCPPALHRINAKGEICLDLKGRAVTWWDAETCSSLGLPLGSKLRDEEAHLLPARLIA